MNAWSISKSSIRAVFSEFCCQASVVCSTQSSCHQLISSIDDDWSDFRWSRCSSRPTSTQPDTWTTNLCVTSSHTARSERSEPPDVWSDVSSTASNKDTQKNLSWNLLIDQFNPSLIQTEICHVRVPLKMNCDHFIDPHQVHMLTSC